MSIFCPPPYLFVFIGMGLAKKKGEKTGKKKSKLAKQVSNDAADRKDHVKIV